MDTKMPIESITKAEKAYQLIRDSILSGELPPRSKIVISRVASQFGISNIPVREALKQLEAEGLVEIIPHTGAQVAAFDAKLLRELYPLRILLEGYAARLSAERSTPADIKRFRKHIKTIDKAIRAGDLTNIGRLNHDFHMDVYRIGGNQRLIGYIEDLWQKSAMAHIVFRIEPSRAKSSNKEHSVIIDAIEQGDGELAEKLVADQNQRSFEILLKHLEQDERERG